MIQKLIDLLMGCSHQRTTFPLSPRRTSVAKFAPKHPAYVTCLDCGKEFEYDWKTMRMGKPVEVRPPSFPKSSDPRPTRETA
jgi:hypothetical protein